MKKINVEKIVLSTRTISEADWRLSASSRAFHEARGTESSIIELSEVIFSSQGIAGTPEKGCNLSDFNFEIGEDLLAYAKENGISKEVIVHWIFHQCTEKVEIVDNYLNVVGTYRIDKSLLPSPALEEGLFGGLQREATEEEMEYFLQNCDY